MATDRCPTCTGPVEPCGTCNGTGNRGMVRTPFCIDCHGSGIRAIDVLPDLLQAYDECDLDGPVSGDVICFILGALAKLGLPDREAIEAAIRDMEEATNASG